MLKRFFVVYLFIASATAYADNSECLGDTNLVMQEKQVTVEVAATERERRYGLMFRNNMGDKCGMLFVFQNTGYRTFTMKNTLIPLDIAFIAADGTILEIFTMQPGVSAYPSKVESSYALELNAGWFDKNSVSTGDVIQLAKKDGNEPLKNLGHR